MRRVWRTWHQSCFAHRITNSLNPRTEQNWTPGTTQSGPKWVKTKQAEICWRDHLIFDDGCILSIARQVCVCKWEEKELKLIGTKRSKKKKLDQEEEERCRMRYRSTVMSICFETFWVLDRSFRNPLSKEASMWWVPTRKMKKLSELWRSRAMREWQDKHSRKRSWLSIRLHQTTTESSTENNLNDCLVLLLVLEIFTKNSFKICSQKMAMLPKRISPHSNRNHTVGTSAATSLYLSLSLSLFVSVFSRADNVPFRMCFLCTCCCYSCCCLLLNFITILFVHFLLSILSSRGERIESIEESISPFVGVNLLMSGSSLLLSFRVEPLRVSSQKWLPTREGKTGALITK